MPGQAHPRQAIEVSGRVRAAATMARPGGGGRCVLATTWQSDRAFPRTAGEAVPFEIETSSGEVFAVDPIAAAVALPVRERVADGGIRRESAWIAPGDEVKIAGDVVEARNGKPARILAHRILVPATDAPHRLPPRTLAAGRAEKEAAATAAGAGAGASVGTGAARATPAPSVAPRSTPTPPVASPIPASAPPSLVPPRRRKPTI